MKEKAVMGFIGVLTALLITITMADVLGNAGKGQLPVEDNGQSSSNTSRPFSRKVEPVSTISTITSESCTIGPNSTEPFNLIISTV